MLFFIFSAGGLTLLALLSLIMDAFRIGYYAGYQSCVSAVLGVYPVIHATHTVAQVSLQPQSIISAQLAHCGPLFFSPITEFNQVGVEIMRSLFARRLPATI